MAKKAKAVKKDSIYADIEKQYGDVISSGMDVLKDKRDYKIISISPAIDLALGGGIREGCWLTLTGDPKSGKTTTAMQIAANCQKEGRPIIYLDVEGRLNSMNFEVGDLDPKKMQVIGPIDKPLPAEHFLDIAYKLLTHPNNHGAVLIIDSISSLIAEKELIGDFSPTRAGLPKILSIFTKKVGQILPNQRGLIIGITHFIANTAGKGKAKLSDGGIKIQYQADTRLEIGYGGEGKPGVTAWENSEGEKIGQIINWNILHSSMGLHHDNVRSYIRFGKGIDKAQEAIVLSCDLGLIQKGGSWYTCSFMQDLPEEAKKIDPELDVEDKEKLSTAFKFQGQDKLYSFLTGNDLIKYLESSIKEMLK